MSVPGIAPERIDVINLSLGEPYAQGSRLFAEALDAADYVGITVVASAGNDGDIPFTVNAPGSGRRALSVAGTRLPGSEGESDTLWSGSARGPGKNGTLKPNLAAPASAESAAMGSGAQSSHAAGTSLSSPHVAGAAALMTQRSRDENLDLSALDVASLLTSYSRRVMSEADPGKPAAVARQGAGRLDAHASGTGKLLVRSGDIAAINLGVVSLVAPLKLERLISVKNISDGVVGFSTAVVFRQPEAGGLTVEVPALPSVLPVTGYTDVPIAFEIDPAQLPSWSPLGRPFARSEDLDRHELDGWISLTVADGESPVVPFYALARQASRLHGLGFASPLGDSSGTLGFANAGPFAGAVELYVVPEGGELADGDEPDVVGEIDMRWVGARLVESEAGQTRLEFAVALHDVAPVPQVTSYEVYLDTTGDEKIDKRLRTGTEYAITGQGSDRRMVVGLADWDESNGAGQETLIEDQPTDLQSRVARFGLPFEDGAPTEVSFFVVHRGLSEDWLTGPDADVVPDGADTSGGPRLKLATEELAYEPKRWSLEVAGNAEDTVTLEPLGGDRQYPFLVLYPSNQFEWRDGQSALIRPGTGPVRPPGAAPIYLPVSLKSHRIYPIPPPNVMVRQAHEELAQIERLRMTYDHVNDANPDVSANRDYTFDGAKGTWLITQWKYGRRHGERDEFILWAGKGYTKPEGSSRWRCWRVDQHMLLWRQMADRIAAEFPATGWELKDPPITQYKGREVYDLRRQAGGVESFVKVDTQTGLPLLLSRIEGRGKNYVYIPRDFNDPTAATGKPRGVNCP
jgi:hypothetical protein